MFARGRLVAGALIFLYFTMLVFRSFAFSGSDPGEAGDRPLPADALHGGRHGPLRLRGGVPPGHGVVHVGAQVEQGDAAERAGALLAGKTRGRGAVVGEMAARGGGGVDCTGEVYSTRESSSCLV